MKGFAKLFPIATIVKTERYFLVLGKLFGVLDQKEMPRSLGSKRFLKDSVTKAPAALKR